MMFSRNVHFKISCTIILYFKYISNISLLINSLIFYAIPIQHFIYLIGEKFINDSVGRNTLLAAESKSTHVICKKDKEQILDTISHNGL